ncbi:integral membrane sensor domain MASE1 [Herbaspirillum sp. Sphag1AN]|uniref:MASE1 domain-containing protein n=1 Tax=unclassified Herbaspirillum TaxID=2624150 RepID=UPI0017B28C6E|nr:integral membrane sensor domain MASE1 [Herbaspirillum sp. Sphag1AN]MBB3244185.1 integral membrane sensor domain MASE1 [Herbaspirillum sp. Sphag64]
MKKNSFVAPLLWAILYFLFGFLSHALNGPFVASGHIWLPAGITVGALLLTPTRRWPALLVALTIAQVLLGLTEQRDIFRMVLFSLDEIGVAAIAVWLVRRAPFPMEGLYFLRGLLMIGIGASLVSAAFGAAWFALTQDVPFWQVLRVWAFADLVGMLILTPVLAGWSQFRALRSGGIAKTEFILGLLAFAAMIGSTYLAFDSELDHLVLDINFSATYLPLFFVALVTLLWGGRGGALAVVVLSLMAFTYNALGRGPFVELGRFNASNDLQELQLFLAVASLLSLLISALKSTREQLYEQASRHINEVEMALSGSRQLFYCIDPQQGSVVWNGDVENLLSQPLAELQSLQQVLALVHPEDREQLRARWLGETVESDTNASSLAFRLVLPHVSGVIEVVDMSRHLLDAEDRLAVTAGAWHFPGIGNEQERGRE